MPINGNSLEDARGNMNATRHSKIKFHIKSSLRKNPFLKRILLFFVVTLSFSRYSVALLIEKLQEKLVFQTYPRVKTGIRKVLFFLINNEWVVRS